MASSSEELHIVYKKDGEGETITVAEAVVNNTIVQHQPCFRHVQFVLNNLDKFPTIMDDIWILAFSKSGTTWVNEIVNLLLHQEPTSMVKDKLIRMLESCQTPSFQQFEEMESPRILNTHMRLTLIPEHLLDNGKIIYCVRNPKSVAVSFYYQIRHMQGWDYNGTFSGFLSTFNDGLLPEMQGSWFDHVTEYWNVLKNKQNALILFYEDIKKNPLDNIRKIADFLGLKLEESFYKGVVEQSSFDAMKSRENPEISKSVFRTPGITFCRKGTVSDWKTHFTVAQNEAFDALYEEKMKACPDLKEKIQFSLDD